MSVHGAAKKKSWTGEQVSLSFSFHPYSFSYHQSTHQLNYLSSHPSSLSHCLFTFTLIPHRHNSRVRPVSTQMMHFITLKHRDGKKMSRIKPVFTQVMTNKRSRFLATRRENEMRFSLSLVTRLLHVLCRGGVSRLQTEEKTTQCVM